MFSTLLTLSLMAQAASGQPVGPAAAPRAPEPQAGPDHRADSLARVMDSAIFYLKMSDIAEVDQVKYTSLPTAKSANSTAPGARNPVVISAYTFIPKGLDKSKKHPMLAYTHGGVHANVNTSSLHIIRELVEQGYTVIAPDYRGSTGYGAEFWRQIDYGGREVDDVHEGVKWMLETYSFLDPKRVGLIGWSHGGLITLMNLFQWPEQYAVAYAGVPVSDLVQRLGYQTDSYRRLFSDTYHIGKTVREDVMEYRRRSPVFHVDKLQTPLLVHTNTNDEDVNVIEVQQLLTAFKAAGKKVESKIYENAPGGHSFNRLDTKLARESRAEIYNFLRPYLKPEPAKK
ncbi:MAG: prolyl oligopeptidase family serine peptidase [Acidobacteria bacterium]|nr:prolyl oligopeptidase family serine peptidase [Acidobacteriota bacterium]